MATWFITKSCSMSTTNLSKKILINTLPHDSHPLFIGVDTWFYIGGYLVKSVWGRGEGLTIVPL